MRIVDQVNKMALEEGPLDWQVDFIKNFVRKDLGLERFTLVLDLENKKATIRARDVYGNRIYMRIKTDVLKKLTAFLGLHDWSIEMEKSP